MMDATISRKAGGPLALEDRTRTYRRVGKIATIDAAASRRITRADISCCSAGRFLRGFRPSKTHETLKPPPDERHHSSAANTAVPRSRGVAQRGGTWWHMVDAL